MSVNMDMDNSDVDYSDFEYEQVTVQPKVNPANFSGNDVFKTTLLTWEPLQDRGGLDTNEVAELVYYRAEAGLEHENGSDQDVGAASEFRGVWGANLSSSQALLSGGSSEISGQVLATAPETDVPLDSGGEVQNRSESFLRFQAYGSPPFDDIDGPGGSNFTTLNQYETHYRDVTGRGPVIDASDDMAVVSNLVCDDTVNAFKGNLKLELVYDISVVDDAGQKFSIPR